MSDGTHAMEQHGNKLNEDNGKEKKDQDNTDGLQMQVLLGDDDLKITKKNNRLVHRKTIHMLEKNRQKKRAIGTLDVAFKKRFFALSGGAGQDPELEGKAARKFTTQFGGKIQMFCTTKNCVEIGLLWPF